MKKKVEGKKRFRTLWGKEKKEEEEEEEEEEDYKGLQIPTELSSLNEVVGFHYSSSR